MEMLYFGCGFLFGALYVKFVMPLGDKFVSKIINDENNSAQS